MCYLLVMYATSMEYITWPKYIFLLFYMHWTCATHVLGMYMRMHWFLGLQQSGMQLWGERFNWCIPTIHENTYSNWSDLYWSKLYRSEQCWSELHWSEPYWLCLSNGVDIKIWQIVFRAQKGVGPECICDLLLCYKPNIWRCSQYYYPWSML